MSRSSNDLYMKIMPVKEFLRLELPKYKDRSHIAAIICSTSRFRPELLRGVQYLRAPFEDVTNGETALDMKVARRIAVFVDHILSSPDITRLYICCDAGQSRSPAVACAITRYLDHDDRVIWKNPKYKPNPHVFRILCKVFDIKITRHQLKKLCKLNERAFARAVRKTRK